MNGDGRFANSLTVASGGIQAYPEPGRRVTGNSTVTGDLSVSGTGTFQNLVATDSLKIGADGDAIAQLNHGTVSLSLRQAQDSR